MVSMDRHAAAGAADDSERDQPASLRDAQGHHGREEEGDTQGRAAHGARGGAADRGAGPSGPHQADRDDRRSAASRRQRARAASARRGAGPMILVVAEHRDGSLNRATLETLAAAQALAGDAPITAAVLGQSVAAVAEELATAASEVLVAEHQTLGVYTPDAFVLALQQIVETVKPTYVLFPHTYQTRDFAPMAAVRLGASLITDVTGIK